MTQPTALYLADVLEHAGIPVRVSEKAADELRRLYAENEALKVKPERRLTDEVIADLWYKHGTFHHHFARAIERWLKGEQ